MLLETLDLRTNDVLIYSQNMFNFNNSFRIIYKNEKDKRAKRISYFDVCAYVKDPSPKNLIIYRLLTNVNNLDAYSTKYGYLIKINEKVELIYFDPIFAIKDLRHLRFDFDPKKFRFKIQQVGLTSLTKKEAEPAFAEVYSFDLRAIEAQNQNDKIFADAIFAFDPDYNNEEFPKAVDERINDENKMEKFFNSKNKIPRVHPEQIVEDIATGGQNMNTPNAPDSIKVHDLREEIIGLLKQALGIQEDNRKKVGGNEKMLERKNDEEEGSKFEVHVSRGEKQDVNVIDHQPAAGNRQPDETVSGNVFDLFKTTSKSNELSERAKETIVLKFD